MKDALQQQTRAPFHADASPYETALEDRYVQQTAHEYRKSKGQFFTPPVIAQFMTDWALAGGAQSVLDPGTGTGIFLRMALAKPYARPRKLIGYDIDENLLELARSSITPILRGSDGDLSLMCTDFLTTPVDQQFDAIICNPPYIRRRDMPYDEAIFEQFDRLCGFRVNRLSNLYGLFLLKIANLMAEHGRAAILTPSDYLNAEFGIPIKRYLLDTNRLDGLIIFDHFKLPFDGVLTTSCITLLRADRAVGEPIRIIHIEDMKTVQFENALDLTGGTTNGRGPGWQRSLVRVDELNPASKWSRVGITPLAPAAMGMVPLRAFARVMRGIATGANSYFTFTEQELQTAGLEFSIVRPCITKAAYAPLPDFTVEDLDGLQAAGKKCFLLDYSAGPMTETLKRYIREGEDQLVHHRHLPNHRNPWYATEKRPPAPIWVTTFGRGQVRFVLNRAGIWNLTPFHCIYPQFEDEAMTKALMTYLISDACTESIKSRWRVYGDGLMKMEPRDVEGILVPDLRQFSRDEIVKLAFAFDQLCAASRQTGPQVV